MTVENDVAALRGELETVRHELGVLQDVKAVRELQFKYGYYMDKCLFPAIVDLFADDAELYFLGGIYRGKAGATSTMSCTIKCSNSNPSAGPFRPVAPP